MRKIVGYSGRLIPVQPHLHTLGMPGSFLIAWFDLISFDLQVSTRGQSRLLFWSRYEVLWSRSDCFENAICVCSCLTARPRLVQHGRARSRSSTSEASSGCSPLTSSFFYDRSDFPVASALDRFQRALRIPQIYRLLPLCTLWHWVAVPHCRTRSPQRFGIRQIELSAVTLTSLPTTCRKWVMSMSSKSTKTNTYRPTLTPTIGNDTSENSRWSHRFPGLAKTRLRRWKDGAWDVFELDFEPKPSLFVLWAKVRVIRCALRTPKGCEWSAALLAWMTESIFWRSRACLLPAVKRSGQVRPSIDCYLSGKYEHKRSRSDWSL